MAAEWGAILGGLKILKDLAEKYQDPIFNDAYMDLQMKIIDLQQDYIRITDENEQLKKAKDLSEKARFERPYVFLEGDPEPYCQRCYDAEGKFIRVGLQKHFGQRRTPGRRCPECKHVHEE